MKKLLYLLVLLLFNFTLKAQFPLQQNIGNDSTLIRIGQTSKGAIRGSLIPSTYTDTTTANLGRIDDYPFAIIGTSSDGYTWQRNYLGTGWVRLGGGTSPSGSFWNVGGNLLPVYPTPYARIGTLTPYGGAISLMTNSVDEVVLSDGGLALLNDTTNTKIMTINPTTKVWGRASWNNGTNIYNSDGTLTGSRLVNLDGNELEVTDNGYDILMLAQANSGDDTWLESTYDLTPSRAQMGTFKTRSDDTKVYTQMTSHYDILDSNIRAWIDLRSNKDSARTLYEATYHRFVGNLYAQTVGYTLSTVGKKIMLRDTASGLVQNIDPSLIGGSTSPAGNFGNIQINRNGAFATPASDSLDFDAGLIQIGKHQITLDNTDYTNTSGAGSVLHLKNPNASGQTVVYSEINGTMVGKWRTDYVGNINWVSGANSTTAGHNFFINGDYPGGTIRLAVLRDGVSIGKWISASPAAATALLHIAAGTATASTAPLKFTSGTNLTTPEAGAMEWDGTNLFVTQTSGPTRKTIAYTSDVPGFTIGNQGEILQVSNGAAAWKYDTTTLVTFTAGANFAADTAAFTDSTIYGSFKLMGNDTFYVTGVSVVLYSNNAITDTLGIQITYNDTINVIGSHVFAATYAVNNGTTGQDADGDDFTGSNSVPIPPGNWVWLKSPTVVAGRKPYHMSVSIIGYKKRVD